MSNTSLTLTIIAVAYLAIGVGVSLKEGGTDVCKALKDLVAELVMFTWMVALWPLSLID